MKTLAVVVTFYPDDSHLENIRAIASQVDCLVVADNTPEIHTERLDELSLSNVKILNNQQNKGIAFALNQGLMLAREQKADYCFTFDQDSSIPANYVNRLIETGQSFFVEKDQYPVLIGPTYTHPTEDVAYQIPVNKEERYRKVEVLMSSGNCINMKQLPEECLFDDELFIDYVDFDFCFNLLEHGLVIIQANDVWLTHSLGNVTTHRLLGKTLQTTNHNHLRRYYITRNRQIVWTRYAEVQKEWISRDKRMNLIEWLKIIFLEEHKLRKVKSIIRGKRDAKRGKLGEYPYKK